MAHLIDQDERSRSNGERVADTERPGDSSDAPLEGGQRGRVWLQRNLLIRLGIALVVATIILIVNPSFIGWGTAVTGAVLAIPTSRYRAYAVAFLPYGAFWLVFSLLRALADETGVALRTAEVTAIERWMFFGVTPTIWLQERLFDPNQIHWYDYLVTFIHWSYFFVPHVIAVLIWRSRPQLYRRYLIATGITLGLGLVIYFLSPAAPPWLTADRAPQQDIYRVMANVGRSLNSNLYDRTYSALGDPNPVAAMPSLHEAITFLVFLFTLNYGWKLATVGFIYAMAMGFTLVYTGEHYVIDAIVGSAIATYAYVFSGRWLNVTFPLFRMMSRRAVPVESDVRAGSD